MADLGGSTTGRISRREVLYSLAHDALEGWGAMLRDSSDGSPGDIGGSAIFREVRSGYRVSSSLPSTYDEDYAIQVDRLLRRVLPLIERDILLMHYAFAMPAHAACSRLDRHHPVGWPDKPKHVSSWDEKRRPKWSRTAYQARLDEAVGRVDMALTLVGVDAA